MKLRKVIKTKNLEKIVKRSILSFRQMSQEIKNLREQHGKSQHIHCRFVMRSAACVERLWSEVDAIVSKRRKGLATTTLGMILFLKNNQYLWDASDVVEADKRRVKAEKGSKAEKELQKKTSLTY